MIDVETVFADDEDVVGGVDDEYQDPQGFVPPKEGNYEGEVLDVEQVMDRTTTPPSAALDFEKYPIFKIQQVEITEPVASAGKVYVFQRVRTAPYKRDGKESEFLDILRSADSTRRVRGSETVEFLNEIIQMGLPVRFRLTWYAEDMEGAKAQKLALGPEPDKKAVAEIYKKHRVTGMRHFAQKDEQGNFKLDADGKKTYSPFLESPSGNVMQARAKVVQWYPSHQVVKIG